MIFIIAVLAGFLAVLLPVHFGIRQKNQELAEAYEGILLEKLKMSCSLEKKQAKIASLEREVRQLKKEIPNG